MKYCSLIIVLCLGLLLSVDCKAQFVDRFDDADLLTNPTWMEDVDSFQVNNEGQLQLNASVTGESQLATQYVLSDSVLISQWVNLDFSPSGSNRLELWLIADSSNNPQNGYFLTIGESGSEDPLTLWYRDNGLDRDLWISSALGSMSSINFKFDFKMSLQQEIELKFDLNADGSIDQNFDLDIVSDLPETVFYMLKCIYTSSRTDKFYFDNIMAEQLMPDITGPNIVSTEVLSRSEINVFFDEAVIEPDLSDFLINPGNITPSNIVYSGFTPNQVKLVFNPLLNNPASFSLMTTNITDQFGNVTVSDLTEFDVLFTDAVEPGDIIFNEIHAAPSVNTALPNVEFVELLNNSDRIINLNELTYEDASSSVLLPEYLLYPNELIVLLKVEDTINYPNIQNKLALDKWPTLNNSGDELSLKDRFGRIIDAINYTDEWYQDGNKTSGYSLELINPLTDCNGQLNWIASIHASGGTPGSENSVLSTEELILDLDIESVFVTEDNSIVLKFKSPMDQLSVLNNEFYVFDPNLTISTILPISNFGNSKIEIFFDDQIAISQLYTMRISEQMAACNGAFWPKEKTFSFGLSAVAERNDIVFSEILFDPKSGGAEFIEIYNNSNKIINLDDLKLRLNKLDGNFTVTTFETGIQILPDQYWVLTEDRLNVTENYIVPNPNQMLATDLPSFTNDGANLLLYIFDDNFDTVHIDEMIYSDDFHDPLLSVTKGVSLEKLAINISGTNANSWWSAATFSGGGTPTGENSQKLQANNSSQDEFNLSSKTFSPDNDGFEDWMQLNYKFDQPGFIANIKVYAHDGYLVKELVQNQSLGQSGFVQWNGDTNDGELARIGIYFVIVEAFTTTGEQINEKLKIVLAKQL